MIAIEIDQNTLIFLASMLFGLSLGRSFRDLDSFIRKRIPEDFKGTFTYYVISGLLRAIHHYLIGLVIMAVYYPPTSRISLAFFSFGLGLVLDEIDLFLKDLKRCLDGIRKLRGLRD